MASALPTLRSNSALRTSHRAGAPISIVFTFLCRTSPNLTHHPLPTFPPPQAVTDAAKAEQSPIAKLYREKKATVPLSREATGLLLRFLQSSQCGLITSVMNEHIVMKARSARPRQRQRPQPAVAE